ncbi:MAG: hypothetical protein H6564_00110 [Lewinellaceae bacterium]|nr:hypothetical protein [Lewinellaceae bacterium]
MKRILLLRLLSFSAVLCLTHACYAQQEKLAPGRMVDVKLRGSEAFVGQYRGQDEGYYTIEEENGATLQLAKGMVKSIEVIPPGRFFDGEYWREPIASFQNLLTPTAFSLKPGEVLYKNISLAYNQVSVGITERTSAGVLFTGWNALGALNPVYGITAKVLLTPPGAPARIAAGALAISIPDDNKVVVDAAVVYGIVTFGTPDRNFSFGLGQGSIDRKWTSQPAYTLSAHYRTGKRVALIAEGWAIPTVDATVGTLGLKALGRKVDWSVSFPAGFAGRQFFAFPIPIISLNTVLHRF